ncbi:MAG TPA: efflux RND transporter periplasmic adaptor subunit [Armatimonadota bacterium]|nr:efflux RND transporter periplasmic adaptor subunit [Armatimonadota bacterium]
MKKKALLAVPVAVIIFVLYVTLRPHTQGGDWVYGSGVIEATEVDVSAQVSGLLAGVEVQEGQSVAAGQVIARIEQEELEAQLRQAEGNVRAAKGDLARSEATLSGARSARENARTAYEKGTELKGRYEGGKAQYEAAAAARDQAKAGLELVQAGAREEEIQQARAAAASAEAEWENAKLELERREKLVAQGAVSRQQVDFQRAAEKAARGTLEAAQARLQEALAGARTEEERQAEAALAEAEANLLVARRALETAKELYADRLELKQRLDVAEAEQEAATEARAAAEGRLESAQGALASAQKRLRDAVITAPLKGVVLLKIREPGETVGPGQPIVRLGDLDHMWLRVYVPETEINRVKLGQKAEVTVDADPGRVFPGEVTEIAQQAEFTPKNVQTREQRVKLVFGVKLSLANPEGELKPGMPAEARISVGVGKGDG